MARMTGGEAVVQALLGHGVEVLFVLPGVRNDALFSALYDHASDLRVLVVRHEQAAGYMAYGYAAASGSPPLRSRPPTPATRRSCAFAARCRCAGSAAASACSTSCPTSSGSCSG
jgi:acetolactate synthase-1/2/3 large subunit